MSCSLALVLMAIVKRTCGMSSWEKRHQSEGQFVNQPIHLPISQFEFYLIHRVNSWELPVHGNRKHLCHQMCPEQVCDGLVILEIGRAHPDLGQHPVILTISGQEDGGVLTRCLPELKNTEDMRGNVSMATCQLQKEMKMCLCTCMAMGRILF